MSEAIKFWLAKELVELAIPAVIIGVVLVVIFGGVAISAIRDKLDAWIDYHRGR